MFTKNIKTHVQQTTKGCGHACLAMILDRNLEDINSLLGSSQTINLNDMMEILRKQGYKDVKIIYKRAKDNSFKYPEFALIMDVKSWPIVHCMILDNQKVIDPIIPSRTYDLEVIESKQEIDMFIKLSKIIGVLKD